MARPGEGLAPSTELAGFLRKNHQGKPFATRNERRYFTTHGFNVFYYESDKKTKPKGHFDLRNVLTLQPATDSGAGTGAVAFAIGGADGNFVKRLVISFAETNPEERTAWLTLWTSAVAPSCLNGASLKDLVNPELTEKLNSEYAEQFAVAPRRSIFKPSKTSVLTPRSASFKQPPLDNATLDTPRTISLPAGLPPAVPLPEPDIPRPDGADDVTFEITVPEGVQPGDKLQATTPSGIKVKLSVPEGAEPGTILTFSLPASVGGEDKQAKAAVLIQARVRGAKTRSSVKDGSYKGKEAVVTIEPEQIDAALKLQKTFRGHQARNEQQEESRLQWMAYYMQPEIAEWDEALALAVSPEEEEQIAAAKAGVAFEEERRLKWFKFYVSTGNFDKAAELVVTEVDAATVIKSRATAPARCCACFHSGVAAAAEEERYKHFVQAIRAYQWEVAEVLALTAEEAQDVVDSKLRVTAMEAALGQNDFPRALEYAITKEELEWIHQAQG